MMLRAIGVMSGTSADGVDIAALDTDGERSFKLLGGCYYPYPKELRTRIFDAYLDISLKESEVLGYDLTLFHIKCVQDAIKSMCIDRFDVIGFSGQTIWHNPSQHISINIGNPSLLAYSLKTRVVSDFRSMDLVAHGNGAPLVPVFHANFFGRHDFPYVVLNIGGVSNITYVHDNEIIAFDIGPGNAIMDDLVYQHTGLPYDTDGKIASGGVAQLKIVDHFLNHDFYTKLPPKSLDRNAWDASILSSLSLHDALATCVDWVVKSVSKALLLLPNTPQNIMVCGGGVHNKFLLQQLQLHNTKSRVIVVPDIDPKMVEAYAFGYLAVRRIYGLQISYPSTTGVAHPICGGGLFEYHDFEPQ